MTELVLTHGGMGDEPAHAVIDGTTLPRAPRDAIRTFKRSASAAADATGPEFVVIGGLPDHEHIAGAEAEADALAANILTAAEPDAHDCATFFRLVAFAERTGMFSISPRHIAALDLLRGASEAAG